MVRGRLIFPATDALVATILEGFPRVSIAAARCPTCKAPGTSWNVQQRHNRSGAALTHHDWCPEPR